MALDEDIRKEYEAYLAQPDDWKERHRGKFVLFKDQKMIAIFETCGDALEEGVALFGADKFLIHRVGDEEIIHYNTFSLLGPA